MSFYATRNLITCTQHTGYALRYAHILEQRTEIATVFCIRGPAVHFSKTALTHRFGLFFFLKSSFKGFASSVM